MHCDHIPKHRLHMSQACHTWPFILDLQDVNAWMQSVVGPEGHGRPTKGCTASKKIFYSSPRHWHLGCETDPNQLSPQTSQIHEPCREGPTEEGAQLQESYPALLSVDIQTSDVSTVRSVPKVARGMSPAREAPPKRAHSSRSWMPGLEARMQARMPCPAASADWAISCSSPGLFSHLHCDCLVSPQLANAAPEVVLKARGRVSAEGQNAGQSFRRAHDSWSAS